MVSIGQHNGRKVAALITDMDTPLEMCIRDSPGTDGYCPQTGQRLPDMKPLCTPHAGR